MCVRACQSMPVLILPGCFVSLEDCACGVFWRSETIFFYSSEFRLSLHNIYFVPAPAVIDGSPTKTHLSYRAVGKLVHGKGRHMNRYYRNADRFAYLNNPSFILKKSRKA